VTAALIIQSSPAPSVFGGILPIILLFAIFYFLLILPMQRQKKKHAQMLATLETGTVVQTNGGIIGTITEINQDTLVIRVKPGDVKLTVARSAVAGTLTEGKGTAS
jgi:preprotein translocase subunit YajC